MRSSTRKALTLGGVAITALMWSGCEAKKQTEYVTGVSTQVQVPRDLRAVRVDVSVGGVVQFCRTYPVYAGKVQLPRSLGEFPQSGSPGPDGITVTVSGFTEEFSETASRAVFDSCITVKPDIGPEGDGQPCGDTKDCAGGAICLKNPDPSKLGRCQGSGSRIIRRSRQPYVKDKVLFLPMPLKYSCFDSACADESKSCKAGRCVDAAIDPAKLPVYTDDLLDGTGGGCFPASQCFLAGAPAVIVNPEDCTYAIPNSPPSSPPQVEGAPPNPFPKSGEGLNVEVTYDGGLNREILDKDAEEGFTFPDPTGKPQQFRLAPGLCDLVKGTQVPVPNDPQDPEGIGRPTAHRITAIRVSGTCRPKTPFQPLCAGDQLAAMGLDVNGVAPASVPLCVATELTPPKAVLMILADDTANSMLFYDPMAVTQFAPSLSDPAFTKTELGLQFFPGPGTCPTVASFGRAVEPKLARRVKSDILAKITAEGAQLKMPPVPPVPVHLDAALQSAYDLLGGPAYKEYYKRGVLVIGNREMDQMSATNATGPAACATPPASPAQRAATAHATSKIDTYVLMLARNTPNGTNDEFVMGSLDLATAGADPGKGILYDARAPANKGTAKDAFTAVVNDLATCVYDVIPPTPRPVAGDTLSYTDPIDPAAPTVTLAFSADCKQEQAGTLGWGVDTDPAKPNRLYLCKSSCDAYRNVLRTAGLYAAQNLQPAIAVPIFSHKQGCSPVPGKTSAGSNPPPAP